MEIAQTETNETRNDVIKLKQQQNEVDKTIAMLKEKLEIETRAAEKRRQLLSLLGPRSKENQVKVTADIIQGVIKNQFISYFTFTVKLSDSFFSTYFGLMERKYPLMRTVQCM